MKDFLKIHEIRLINAKKLLVESGLKRNELSEKIGMSYNLLSQYIGKNPTKNIGDETAAKIEAAFNKPSGFLDQVPTQEISKPLDNNINLKEKINIEGRGIPVISWVSAGTFTTIDVVLKDTEIEEFLPPNKDCGKNGYGLIVTGVSMSPKFEPNDRIYVNPDYPVSDLKTGDLVVVGRLGETEATFKELIIEGQTKYLRPLNPNWGEQIIKFNSGDKLLGKVVGLYRKI